MKIVIQRVKECSCTIDAKQHSKINNGLLCYVGIANEDNEVTINKAIDKIINLRVFEDEQGKMNLSLLDLNYELMLISQFTLFGNCAKGNRPSFVTSGAPEHAKKMYEEMVALAKTKISTKDGVFAADMKINYTNDGPVTLIYEL